LPWGTPKKTYIPECLVANVKHGDGSVTIWAVISWYSSDPINPNGRIAASDYVDILGKQVHPVVQMLFPNIMATFQDDNSPILTATSVQSWFSGPRRSTSTSFLSSTIARVKPYPANVENMVSS
jgi:hypothetical protein